MTMRELVLECIPKSRSITEPDLLDRIIRGCKKLGVLPLSGQIRTSLVSLCRTGAIRKQGDGVIRSEK